MKHLLNLSVKDIESFFKALGEKPFRAQQVLKWVYRKNVDSFSQMTDLSPGLRAKLEKHFFINSLEVESADKSSDGTERFNLKTKDDYIFPCVWLVSKSRNTLCLSTQIGCPIGCGFCASGSDFKRNLTAGEIVEQILVVSHAKRREAKHSRPLGQMPDGVLFMGMGEPLLNYDGVARALRVINSSSGLNIGSRHITLSTVGIVAGIKKLAQEKLKIRLAVSLHTPDDDLRKKIIPYCKDSINDILSSAFEYSRRSKTRLTLEYILLKNITDNLDCAKKLSLLIKKHLKPEDETQLRINLIPYNPSNRDFAEPQVPMNEGPNSVDSASKIYAPPSKEWQKKFKNFLISNGFLAIIRENKGRDIKSACGQLGI